MQIWNLRNTNSITTLGCWIAAAALASITQEETVDSLSGPFLLLPLSPPCMNKQKWETSNKPIYSHLHWSAALVSIYNSKLNGSNMAWLITAYEAINKMCSHLNGLAVSVCLAVVHFWHVGEGQFFKWRLVRTTNCNSGGISHVWRHSR